MQPINETDPPSNFVCPISLDIMTDPVILQTGQTYDRASIQKWFDKGNRTCPVSMQKLSDYSLTPNHMLRRLIREWSRECRVKQGLEDEETLKGLLKMLQVSDKLEVCDILRMILAILTDREHLRRGFMEDSDWPLLFSFLNTQGKSAQLVLCILVQLLPLNANIRKALADPERLPWLFVRLVDVSRETQTNAAKILKFLLDSREVSFETASRPDVSSASEGLISEKEDPIAVAAGLGLLKALIIRSKNVGSWISNTNFVLLLVDLLPNSNPECVELALEILDTVSTTPEGQEALQSTLPRAIFNLAMVVLKFSEKCTLYAVLILLVIFKITNKSAAVATSFKDSGLPRKLLLLLQSNCGPALKKRCVELLKLLSQDRKADSSLNFETVTLL